MMYSKLALRNVKKSFRDYAIYFLTLMFGVCIFYVFNSIDGQQSMMVITESAKESMKTLERFVGCLSVFVSIILGFLIVYANRFLVRRRKKELAIYQVLGMKKGQVSRILTIETLLVAIISLAVGLGLGVLLSQGFALLTASLFEVKIASFKFVFSSSAALKAMLYFGIAFVLVIIFNRITVGRQKLLNLLHANRKNEKFKIPLVLSVIIFVASVVILGIAYYIIETEKIYIDDTGVFQAIALGIIGTFLFFFSLSGFFLKVVQKTKKFYFRGLNMFVLRQINSKIGTTFVSISMVCLMLFLAIFSLSFAIGFSRSITEDLEKSYPFDLSYSVYSKFEEYDEKTEEFIPIENVAYPEIMEELKRASVPIEAYAKRVEQIKYYDLPDEYHTNSYFENREEHKDDEDYYFDEDYVYYKSCLKLSDYNKLLEMQGKPSVTLKENEYIINYGALLFYYDGEKETYDEYNEYYEKNKVNVSGTELTLKSIEVAPLRNCDNTSAHHVLPDKLLENTESYSSYLIMNYIDSTHEYRDLREKATNEMIGKIKANESTPIHDAWVLDKVTDFEETKASAVTISYLWVYIGIVFAIISAVVLAITQLSEASDNAHRYGLLRKLGADGRMINRALFSQIAIYFGVPLFLAIVHSVFGLRFANDLLTHMGESSILRESIITAGVIIAIYGGYFLATYFGSKRIIGSK